MTDDLDRARGVQVRLLWCDTCFAVWPTERDVAHGGSRLDGEPCAYRWPEGRVCRGTVHPVGPRRRKERDHWVWEDEVSPRVGYSGKWCKELGVPWGTTDLALVRTRYRALCKERHPDAGGSHEAMVSLNAAYVLALAELGQR